MEKNTIPYEKIREALPGQTAPMPGRLQEEDWEALYSLPVPSQAIVVDHNSILAGLGATTCR